MAENIIYSMYVCPECRKVFKVKGNDKKVKCSHCEGIYLKDMHVEEPVWKAYGKDERDKIISNMLVEEEFEEAFEEAEAYLAELEDVELDETLLNHVAGGQCYSRKECSYGGTKPLPEYN